MAPQSSRLPQTDPNYEAVAPYAGRSGIRFYIKSAEDEEGNPQNIGDEEVARTALAKFIEKYKGNPAYTRGDGAYALRGMYGHSSLKDTQAAKYIEADKTLTGWIEEKKAEERQLRENRKADPADISWLSKTYPNYDAVVPYADRSGIGFYIQSAKDEKGNPQNIGDEEVARTALAKFIEKYKGNPAYTRGDGAYALRGMYGHSSLKDTQAAKYIEADKTLTGWIEEKKAEERQLRENRKADPADISWLPKTYPHYDAVVQYAGRSGIRFYIKSAEDEKGTPQNIGDAEVARKAREKLIERQKGLSVSMRGDVANALRGIYRHSSLKDTQAAKDTQADATLIAWKNEKNEEAARLSKNRKTGATEIPWLSKTHLNYDAILPYAIRYGIEFYIQHTKDEEGNPQNIGDTEVARTARAKFIEEYKEKSDSVIVRGGVAGALQNMYKHTSLKDTQAAKETAADKTLTGWVKDKSAAEIQLWENRKADPADISWLPKTYPHYDAVVPYANRRGIGFYIQSAKDEKGNPQNIGDEEVARTALAKFIEKYKGNPASTRRDGAYALRGIYGHSSLKDTQAAKYIEADKTLTGWIEEKKAEERQLRENRKADPADISWLPKTHPNYDAVVPYANRKGIGFYIKSAKDEEGNPQNIGDKEVARTALAKFIEKYEGNTASTRGDGAQALRSIYGHSSLKDTQAAKDIEADETLREWVKDKKTADDERRKRKKEEEKDVTFENLCLKIYATGIDGSFYNPDPKKTTYQIYQYPGERMVAFFDKTSGDPLKVQGTDLICSEKYITDAYGLNIMELKKFPDFERRQKAQERGRDSASSAARLLHDFEFSEFSSNSFRADSMSAGDVGMDTFSGKYSDGSIDPSVLTLQPTEASSAFTQDQLMTDPRSGPKKLGNTR